MSTKAMGAHNRKQPHVMCRRCGKESYLKRKRYCSHCGYGTSSKIKAYAWLSKKVNGQRKY